MAANDPKQPINAGNFPTSGVTPESVATFQATVAEAAKKIGVTLQKSSIEAFKIFSKASIALEKQIADEEKKRFAAATNAIDARYAKEFRLAAGNVQKEAELKKAKLKEYHKAELTAKKNLEKETAKLSRPGYGQLMKKEMGNLPGVGGMISTLQGGGMAALGVAATMAGITAIIAAVGTLVSALFKAGTESTATGLAFTKAGVAQKDFSSALSAYSTGAWKEMGVDLGEMFGALSDAPNILKDSTTHLQTFQNAAAKMGVSILDSTQLVGKASIVWGGDIGMMLKQIHAAQGLMQKTGMSFNSLFEIMQDLDPAFKNVTFSADKAANASRLFASTMSIKLGKEGLGMTQEEIKQTTSSLADFASKLSLPTLQGMIAYTEGGPLKSSKEVGKLLNEDPLYAIKELFKFSNKLEKQGGDPGQIIAALAAQGAIPGEYVQPKKIAEFEAAAGGTTEEQDKYIKDMLKKVDAQTQAELALKKAQDDNIQTLAKLHTPLENLATSLGTLVEKWVTTGALLRAVDNLQEALAHPENIIKGLFGMDRTGPPVSSQKFSKPSVGKNPRDSFSGPTISGQ